MHEEASAARAARIAELNDAFRRTRTDGLVVVTNGVMGMGPDFTTAAMKAVEEFDTFTESNDPWHEHDFGSVEIDGQKLFWKIDYYDGSMVYGSEDPADPSKTTRVLTVMLSEEY